MLTTKIGKSVYYHHRIAGLLYKDVEDRLQTITLHLTSMGYEVMHPFIGFTDLAPRLGPLYIKDMYQNSRLSDKAAFNRSKWLVQSADIVLVDFTMIPDKIARPAIGAVTALIWGNTFNKHTLVVMEQDSLYDHAFVRQAADIVFLTIEDAFKYLSELSILNVTR